MQNHTRLIYKTTPNTTIKENLHIQTSRTHFPRVRPFDNALVKRARTRGEEEKDVEGGLGKGIGRRREKEEEEKTEEERRGEERRWRRRKRREKKKEEEKREEEGRGDVEERRRRREKKEEEEKSEEEGRGEGEERR